jgi:uncharacterized membrane protein
VISKRVLILSYCLLYVFLNEVLLTVFFTGTLVKLLSVIFLSVG